MGWLSRIFGSGDDATDSADRAGSDGRDGDGGAGRRLTEADAPPAGPLLERLAREPDVPDDLAERATVVENFTETVRGEGQTKLTVTETGSASTLTAEKYASAVADRVPMAERYDHAPDGFEERVVRYVRTGDEPFDCEVCGGVGRHDCPACRGRGRRRCPTCDGEGRHVCRQCGGTDWYDCEECDGTGRVDVDCAHCGGDSWDECSTCGGRGERDCQDCSEGAQGCPVCDGGGTVVETATDQCPRCRGRGTHGCPDHEGADESCRRCDAEGTVDCVRCDGAGVEEVERSNPCPDCGGEATVECETCDGTATVECPACWGAGGSTCDHCGGADTEPCPACEGAGEFACDRCADVDGSKVACTACDERNEVACTRCDESHVVECSKCEGEGRLVETEGGTLSFERRLDQGPEFTPTKIRPVWLEADDGTEIDRETLVSNDPSSAASIVRWADRVWEVEVHYVRCAYDGTEYEVVDVDGDLRYERGTA